MMCQRTVYLSFHSLPTDIFHSLLVSLMLISTSAAGLFLCFLTQDCLQQVRNAHRELPVSYISWMQGIAVEWVQCLQQAICSLHGRQRHPLMNEEDQICTRIPLQEQTALPHVSHPDVQKLVDRMSKEGSPQPRQNQQSPSHENTRTIIKLFAKY